MKTDQLENLFQQAPDMPEALAEKIRGRILLDTHPVKPLMGGLVYGLLIAGLSIVVATLFAVLLGFKGWYVLPPKARMEMLAVLLAFALSGTAMVVRSMRPGSGNLHSVLLAAFSLVAYEGLVATLFSDYSTAQFLHRGLLCLGLGVLTAAIASVPMWLIIRQGFIVQKVHAGAVMGLVCSLAGLMALTLHCDVITAPHAGVWHAAVIVVCVALGAMLGRMAAGARDPG